MTVDLTKTQFSSTNDTFKNSTSEDTTFTLTGASIGPGASIVDRTISLSRGELFTQIKVNLSYQSTKWYIPPTRPTVIAPSASVILQILPIYTSTTLTLRFIFIPTGVGPWSYSTFTCRLKANLFIPPV